MPEFIRPELDELSVHQEMVQDRKTMDFFHRIIEFPRSQWSSFYEEWVDRDSHDAYYRLVYCPGCEDFVGEAGWVKDDDSADLYLLVKANKREMGYGDATLKMLVEEAEKNGFSSMKFKVDSENPSVSFLKKRGFRVVDEKDHITTLVVHPGELLCQEDVPCDFDEELA